MNGVYDDPKNDRDSDRYVEMRASINGESIGGGVYANPAEAVYAMIPMNTSTTVFELFCYSKKNHQVMHSGRFNRARKIKQLIGVSSGWDHHPVFRTEIRGRKKWNYERPFGVRKRPTLGYFYAEDIVRRLKSSFYFKKPMVVKGVSHRDIPPEHDRMLSWINQMNAQNQN